MEPKSLAETAELVSGLVKIPSVTGNAAKAGEAADFIVKWLGENGVSAKIKEFEKGFPTVIAQAGSGSRSLMLNGHLDVVPEGDHAKWGHDPYSGLISGKTVFGRGSVDMKSGLAVQMRLLSDFADKTDFRLIFAAVSDEETGGFNCSKHLAEEYLVDTVLVGEPGGSELIGVGEKGLLDVRLSGRGKTSHASRPSLGDNAIMKVVRDLERLSKVGEIDIQFPTELKEILQESIKENGKDVGIITFNPGTINGGTKLNVVPDACESDVDMRIPPGISIDNALSRIKGLLKEVDVSLLITSEPNYTSPTIPEVAKFIRIAKKHAPNARLIIKNGGTDGRYFRSKGMPVVAFGPGNYGLMHTYDECVSFSEIARAYDIYSEFLSSF